MSDEVTKTKKERLKEALKTFGHIFLEDILPAAAKVVLPILVGYLTKKGIDTASTSTSSPE